MGFFRMILEVLFKKREHGGRRGHRKRQETSNRPLYDSPASHLPEAKNNGVEHKTLVNYMPTPQPKSETAEGGAQQ